MEHYNRKGWMQPMAGETPSHLRTFGELFGNALGARTDQNTTDLLKDVSEIKAEWKSYELIGSSNYEIKINDNPIRDLKKVALKYGPIVEGGPSIWYYVFKRADAERVQFIVSPWYVKKYNNLKDNIEMTDRDITAACSEYVAQQARLAEDTPGGTQGVGYEDPVDGLDALLKEVNDRTKGFAGPETIRKLPETRGKDRPHEVELSAGRHGGTTHGGRAPKRHVPQGLVGVPPEEVAARAAAVELANTGLPVQSPSGAMYGAIGGSRKRRYTKKIKKRSSKKRRSKKRRSKKRRSRR